MTDSMFCISKNKILKVAGFSLIEMLVYISILVLVCGGALTLLFSQSDNVQEQRASTLLLRSSESALERVLLDIRNADTIDLFYSALETSPGVLLLVEGATTTRFFLEDATLKMELNGGGAVALTDEKVSVDSLRFYAYDNGVTEMARVEITVSSTIGEATVTKTFNAGATLRGSYE